VGREHDGLAWHIVTTLDALARRELTRPARDIRSNGRYGKPAAN
jgi:hypothetical protein